MNERVYASTDTSSTTSTLNNALSISGNDLIKANRINTDDKFMIPMDKLDDDEEKSLSGKGGMTEGEEELPELEEWGFPDGGLKAWTCILCCFVFSSSQLGYGLAWGSFLQQLRLSTYAEVPLAQLNLIAGLSNFMMSASSFVGGRLGDKYGYKFMIAVGGAMMFSTLVIAAFTYQHLALIFLFQGFFLGIAQGVSLPIVMSIPSQYFLKKRGLATGIAISGTGFGGAISSLLVRALLPSMGYRNTLLIYAGINAVAYGTAWYLLEIRLAPLKPGESRVPKNWLPKGVWSDIAFYSFCGCVAIGVWGYYSPFYFITAYTIENVPSLDPNSLLTAFPLIIMNVASGFGRIASGQISDFVGPVQALFLTYFLGGFFQIVFWPYATSYGSIVAFGICYAFVGTGFISLIPVAAAQLFGTKNLATITGFVVLTNSPGQFLASTVAAVVLSSTGSYSSMARYSGGIMSFGGAVMLVGRYAREKKLFAKY